MTEVHRILKLVSVHGVVQLYKEYITIGFEGGKGWRELSSRTVGYVYLDTS